ncbi:hypothetical protein PVNG_05831 [Plasmodium vivax North Korean]|uniref:Variable surface protein Vir35 n=1 Tax=Plasmodium vivax North Korean TaxID=1035514 RepID=A0A0J9WEM2_PLAVI|nr:hypothetical protein PVNG_05831 [Plasmodium vivax North Korean]
MVLLSNCNIGKNVMFTGFLKYFAFTFLIWTYHTCKDLRNFPKSLENKHEHDNILNISICRLLARYEQKNELIDSRFKDNLPDRNPHKNRRNVSEHIPTYSSVRSKASNNFDLYMKNYKNRYRKKKGLSKLDCYYENKVFRKFKNMCDIAEKVHDDKKSWKRFFLKKYGIGLIIFTLLPTIGLIFPILFGIGNGRHGIIEQCPKEHFDDQNKHKTPPAHNASGKGKMNIKAYCQFCKDIF